MELKDIANYFGVKKQTFKKNMDQDIFDSEIKKEYEIIKNMSLNDLIEEYIKLYKKMISFKEDMEYIDNLKKELKDRNELFKILLHRYEYSSDLNIEYMKRYGNINKIDKKKHM